MKRLNKIVSAEEGDSKVLDAVAGLKDDFDYIISGLEKLDRSGAEAANEGLIIAEQLESTFQDIISSIAEEVSE